MICIVDSVYYIFDFYLYMLFLNDICIILVNVKKSYSNFVLFKLNCSLIFYLFVEISLLVFCQGLKLYVYVCEKYSNMFYGDDNKWGGCLEIYGGVFIKIFDI